MEIRRWHCYVVINCALIIPCLFAKTFSLNEAIAEESRQRQQLETTIRPTTETTAEHFSLNKALKTDGLKSKKIKTAGALKKPFSLNKAIAEESRQKQQLQTTIKPKGIAERLSLIKGLNLDSLKTKKFKTAESFISKIRKISPLKYRKTYQIKTPLKPKKLKYKQKSRLRRKNQSIKREVVNNEKIDKKYIPLIKSLGMLFDNLLTTDASDSTEVNRNKYRRNRNNFEETSGVSCSCSRKSDSQIAETRTSKKTITSTTTLIGLSTDAETATIETTTSATDNTPSGDVRSFGSYTDLPLLLARDSPSSWGDNNRFSEGSSSTLHGSAKGDISGDHRNSEYNTGRGQNSSSPTNYEKDPYGFARDDTSSDGTTSRILGIETDFRTSIHRSSHDKSDESTENENAFRHIRGDIIEFKRENNHEIGGNKTESEVFVPKFIRGFRGYVPQYKDNSSESLQSKEDREKSVISVAHDNASDKRITVRNGELTAENQKTSTTNEAVITIKDLSNPILVLQKTSKTKAPMVTIIDGYSVARHT